MNDTPLAFADVQTGDSQSETVREPIASEGPAPTPQAPPSDRPAVHAGTPTPASAPAPAQISTSTSAASAVAKPKAANGRDGMLTGWLIAAAVLLYVVLAALAVDGMSGAIVMLGRHQHVSDVSLTTTLDVWRDAHAS